MNQKNRTMKIAANVLMLLVFSLLAVSFVQAASLHAPSAVPEKIAFLFSVDLPQSTFSHTQVFYDNKLIVTAQFTGSVAVDPANGKFVLAAFTSQENGTTTLYISYIEKQKGIHPIKIIVYDNTTILEEINESIEATEEFSSGNNSMLLAQINQLEASLDDLQTEIDSLNTNFGSIESSTQQTVQQTTQELNADLEGALNEINSIKSLLEGANKTGSISLIQQSVLQERLDVLEENTQTLNVKLELIENQVESQKQKIVSMLEKENGGFETGFFSLDSSGALLGGVIIVMLIVGVWFFRTKKTVIK
ncbi:hypothetical protein KKE06_03475 [Candidatus Micrarchaeota archaeon]|nr:hypothetical protein [Candidatus Micrarchaeota archaeon]MBU1930278.1 hypothetical protein [Candidatus Micrarchaeota archaeon]